MTAISRDDLLLAANTIRGLAMDGVEKASSGHPGMPMGMADVATVLWSNYLKYDASAPDWADRDRFVLSAGHGSMLIYSLLHLAGYAAPTMEDIRNFRQLGSPCAGHRTALHSSMYRIAVSPRLLSAELVCGTYQGVALRNNIMLIR